MSSRPTQIEITIEVIIIFKLANQEDLIGVAKVTSWNFALIDYKINALDIQWKIKAIARTSFILNGL